MRLVFPGARRLPGSTWKSLRATRKPTGHRSGARDLPMDAKGMNLALYDAETFVNAARDYVRAGDDSGLRAHPGPCLARPWRYQEYADWWSHMLFSRCGKHAAADPYAARVAKARFARFTE